jgi:hypothetical protein
MVVARESRDGKSFYTKIGVAWPMEKGGYRLVFEALPAGGLNRDGKFEVTALLFPPRDDAAPRTATTPQPGSFDDEIHF